MTFDLPTLLMAGGFVAVISGVFLVFAWMQTEEARGVLWWAGADLLLGASVPMMATATLAAGSARVIIGITILNLSPALIWASARAVNRKPVELLVVASAPAIWLIAMLAPVFRESANLQIGLNLTLSALFLSAAAYEFWRGREDHLSARWPLVVLLVLHAASCVFGGLDILFFDSDPSAGIAVLHSWLAFVHLETLAFVVGTSIFTVAMARERNEMVHRLAASVDALTGVATRRAFYERGEALIAGMGDDPKFAIVLFDVDGFKGINDTFGHARGDRVLRDFGAAALRTLRSTDVIGRLGGDEFCALLPGASVGAAYIAAERIRTAFTKTCQESDDTCQVTISAGVAAARPSVGLDALLQVADLALYRAKLQGRNRVEVDSGSEADAAALADAASGRQRQVA